MGRRVSKVVSQRIPIIQTRQSNYKIQRIEVRRCCRFPVNPQQIHVPERSLKVLRSRSAHSAHKYEKDDFRGTMEFFIAISAGSPTKIQTIDCESWSHKV